MANKKCLVFETMNNISNTMSIVESSNPKEVRLTGVFGVAGIKNNNNRIYDKQNYGMMIESLQKVIATEGCLGELEHPNSMNIDLNNVSHKIESIEMNEDGTVTGTIVLLDTTKGKNAKAIVEAGVPLYISSRAAGSIDESGHVTLTNLKTYDLVGTPGFSQAKLNLSENQTFEALNESLCVIYEDDKSDDDLLGGGDSSDSNDKPEDKPDEKKDKEEKKDSDSDNKDEDKADDKDSKEKDKKEDNNKNNDKEKATMQEIKKAIDELTEKVESLQADLHVAQESLKNKDEEIKALTEKLENLEIPELNYDAIQNWITEEYAPEFKNEIMESVEESIDHATEIIGEGVQNWTVNEFAPIVEKYIVEEFAPEVQNWVTEEFAPEVQNWVIEEYSPMIEGYLTEEFAPEVENWINEELMPTVDAWINEECIPEHKSNIINEVQQNVNEFFESQKVEKLSSIDNLLEAIENKDKDEVIEQLKENKVDEKYRGLYVVENMPAEYTPNWSMLNEDQQADIIRRSRMYDFTKQGVLEKFWASIDFAKINESINENQNQDNVDTYHAGIFAKMKLLRKA